MTRCLGRSCLLTFCRQACLFPLAAFHFPLWRHRRCSTKQSHIKQHFCSPAFPPASFIWRRGSSGLGQGRLSPAAAGWPSSGRVAVYIAVSCPPACRAEWRGGDQSGPGAKLGQERLVCSSGGRLRLGGRHGAEEGPGQVQEAADWD